MISSRVFKQAIDLTEKKFPDSSNGLRILFGFASLAGMNDNTLKIILDDPEDIKEIRIIRSVIEENELDMSLMKQGIPLLDAVIEKNDSEPVLNYESDTASHSLQEILEAIISSNATAIRYLKKGNSLDDILSYVENVRRLQPGHDKSSPQRDKEPEKNSGSGKALPDKDAASEEESDTLQAEESEEAEKIVSDTQEPRRERFGKLVEKTEKLYRELSLHIIGQNEAVRMFAQGYFQSEVLQGAQTDRKTPGATFLFAGPPGVGKTFMATKAAEALGLPFLRLDMSSFSTPDAVHHLSGYPKAFQGAKPGELTAFVTKNPRCVILLDEIEKAHDDVIYQFLQVLDGGKLKDDHTDITVSFLDTILIFTTNAGKSLYELRDRDNLSSLPRSVVLAALESEKDAFQKNVFPQAICSRFSSGNLIMFNYLGAHDLLEIVNSQFMAFQKQIREVYGFEITFDPYLASTVLFSQSTSMDARNIASQSMILLKNEMYELGRFVRNAGRDLTNLKNLTISVKIPEKGSEERSLFINGSLPEILYFGRREDYEKIPTSSGYQALYAGTREEMKELIVRKDLSAVLLDLEYGATEAGKYLSLDDLSSDGVKAFAQVREQFPAVPVYVAVNTQLSEADRVTFYEKGCRGFIDAHDRVELEAALAEIGSISYLQKKTSELAQRSRVLSYNTAQSLSEDGTSAQIIFYDFQIKIAADAAENSLLLSNQEKPEQRFADVIGSKNAKDELQYFVDYMKNPRRFIADGIKMPKGILLYGPPGTGKTMLARAMAGECDVPFFPTDAASFQDRYVGEGERRIRELFSTARKFAPSIIFIDEIDAIGKERSGSTMTQYTETLLNTLLTEMDGFETNESRPVFVIAATNFDLDGTQSGKAARMDPALIRRFDNRIYVDLPNQEERKEFLTRQLKKVSGSEVTEEALNNLAQRTTGESLAVINNILDLALRNSSRSGKALNDQTLLEAMEEFMYGEKKEWTREYYESVSIHESGHAYISYLSGEKPSFVTIVSRSNFGGYMQGENPENTPSYTADQLRWKIRVALAGRAAELVFFGKKEGINTGVASDLSHATRLAMSMICRYGMDDDCMVSIEPEVLIRSENSGTFINRINDILKEELQNTIQLIQDGRNKVKALSEYLLKCNMATEKEISKCFSNED